MEFNFVKIEFYATQENIELELEKIEFHACHILLNCTDFNFVKIEYCFELDFEKVKFQKRLYKNKLLKVFN